jgi:hypothetical protein
MLLAPPPPGMATGIVNGEDLEEGGRGGTVPLYLLGWTEENHEISQNVRFQRSTSCTSELTRSLLWHQS